ncbi:hypothetical protein CHUAL_011294 [Chamberlinius hualienensis]
MCDPTYSRYIFVILIDFCVFNNAWGILEPYENGVKAYVTGFYTLTCTLQSDYNINQVTSIYWYYYPYNEYSKVLQVEDIVNDIDITATTNLTVSVYYSGYYKCEYILENGYHKYAVFHDNDFVSVSAYGSYCSSQSQCITLNAKCDNKSHLSDTVCNCHGDYPVPYLDQPYNPQCLKAIDLNGICVADNQCIHEKPKESYKCIDGECKCVGEIINIFEENRYMCITPAVIYQSCYYDEQCILNTILSHCENYCQCNYGYTIDNLSNLDCREMTFWEMYSTGITIGIGLAFVFGFIIIIRIFNNSLKADKFNRSHARRSYYSL